MAIKDRPKLKAFLINALRRASYRWPGRYLAAKRTHIGRNQYFCENCGVIYPKKETQMDHIVPIVDPEIGWVDLDVYADRMYCDESGWQRLCLTCHSEKTSKENQVRKKIKKKQKKT